MHVGLFTVGLGQDGARVFGELGIAVSAEHCHL